MRISLSWLKELVEVTLTPEALAEALTIAGFEVEDIEDRRTWADGVVVGKVLQCEPHPNADKLRVCQVDIGAETPSTIVCGAANVRADAYVPVATLGTYLPMIDLKIRPAKLRGVASEGMICSLAELGLAKESDGIHIFAQPELKPGTDARPLLGLDDVILDVTSTANRADALSMVGIAREVAALTGAPLRLPHVAATPTQLPCQDLTLAIDAPQACPAYIGTVIKGVTIAPSPLWMQHRLQASGIRPINNVVDITNYILLEWGQPLHAFDYDRLLALSTDATLPISICFASAGHTLKTLDGQDRTLHEQNLVISAYQQPVAIAGVMGGEATEVYDGTTNLLLEAAVFDSATIRRSARAQGLRTEASIRYERGVNHAELLTACQRAIQLLRDVTGGTPVSQAIAGTVTEGNGVSWTRVIDLRLDRVQQLLGNVELEDGIGDIQSADVEKILTALGCQLAPGEQEQTWRVTVPPYRYRDLEREIDLIEEIARLYGYDHFCDTLPAAAEPGYLSLEEALERQLREACRAVGLTEVMHYSLVKPGGDRQIVITNPLFTEYAALRTNLLDGLLDAFQYNVEQGNGGLNAFEIGRIFWQDEEGGHEIDAIGGIMGGDPSQGRWRRGGREHPLDWFEAKGLLESVFQRLDLTVEYQPDRRDPRLHPGRTASLWIQGDRLGTFGQLHPQLQDERGLPYPVYLFELDLGIMLLHMDEAANQLEPASDGKAAGASAVPQYLPPRFKPFSTFPASDRDLALYAPIDIAVADLQRTITKAGGALLESVQLFDEYRGENVPAGHRSLAFRLVYRADDRTLTDGDIEPIHQQIRDALVEKFRVELRS
ncbi:MAG: phenylalanine--tRNA ligase subunit beta [Cyanobacteria bacterium]|nr:phenylalanine--tRNA ligase subunit beta [Cyanobacteriota bacterium]MDW8200517.1 phenylalanine--tRNA ligase subunit beta [Cyanobacteriota bacterium SKYGB_h_bin112]